MRLAVVLVSTLLLARVGAADSAYFPDVRDAFVVEAPFAFGVNDRHTTVGGHLGASYNADWLFLGGGAEWTLLLGDGTLPQAWFTPGASLSTGGVLVYAGPSIRFYDRIEDHENTGPSLGLTGEVGVRALLIHTRTRRRVPTTTGVIVRADAPIAGDLGWSVSICLAVGPSMKL